MATKSLDGLFNQVVDDPDVVAAVKSLALETIAQARDMLAPHTAPHLRVQMVRSVLPTLVRSLEANRDANTDDELRAQMAELLVAVKG